MKTQPSRSRTKTVIATGGLTSIGGLLGWLGTSTLRNIEEIERTTFDNKTRIEALEKDDAKWGTLAELKRDLTKAQIDLEVLRRLFRMTRSNLPNEPDTIEVPTAEEEKRDVDPDSFRQIQEQRFPSKK